ncbi:MAG: hypothetical protein P4L26_01955 [Terracidiphilus sp.]|nr:hypothetical protein [Terracidiphilus sp.]
MKKPVKTSIALMMLAAACLAAAPSVQAAQLSTDARTAVPHEVQQLVVIDYRAMQNSAAAMDLRGRVMPPELKQFDDALTKSGLNENHDVEQLAFALFRTSASTESLTTVGIAQGQFPEQDILANFRKNKVKPTLVRTNKLYPLAKTGMVLCFVDASTMIFGAKDAVQKALDARDGVEPSMLTNGTMMEAMKTVDTAPLWSILDEKGTRVMMKQVLGEAGSLTDFDTVQKRLQGSWYGMDFQHGVKFDLTISTGDTFAAATISSLLTAAVLVRKMSGSAAEKQALADTAIASDSGRMSIHFAANDNDFSSLLRSPLFQSMVH